MLKKYERIDLGNGININLYNTDKFKSNFLSFYFKRPLARKEITKNALLPLVIKRGTNKFKTNKELDRKLESLYGANLSIGINKKGEKQVLRYSLEWAAESYTSEVGLDIKAIDMLEEIIFNPLINDESFNEEYVNQEKKNLKNLINGRVNNKRSYTINKCIETMCKNERFGHYPLGYLEDIDEIDGKNLYTQYKEIISNSPVEIVYVGNNIENIKEYLIKNYSFKREDQVYIREDVILDQVQTKNMVKEKMDVSQGKLAIGYRSGIKHSDELFHALVIGNLIFGGDATSRLFKNVREKENLAYSIGSNLYKYKSIIIADAGINVKDLNKTIDIITKELDDIKNGNILDEEIIDAKENIKSSIESIDDSQFGISEVIFGKTLTNDFSDMNVLLEKYMSVTKKEIIEAMNTLSMDTIYCLVDNDKEIEVE